jgi:hypothetical protein
VQPAKFRLYVGAASCTINIAANIWYKNGKGVSKNCVAALAARIITHTDMLTRLNVYSFGAFLHDYWCCKQDKLKTGEMQKTVSHTPHLFGLTSPINWAGESKNGNIYFSRWQPSFNIKEHRSPQLKNTIQR